MMCKFRTGNVIRVADDFGGSLWVVTDVTGPDDKLLIHAVDFSHENCSAVQQYEDHERSRQEYDTDDCNCTNEDVMVHGCLGHSKMVKVKGWKHAKKEADCVQDFIMKRLKKVMTL